MRNMWNDFNRRATAVVTVLVLVFAVSFVLADRGSKSTSDQVVVLASDEEPEELETIPENTTVPVTVDDPPVSASTTLTTVATTTTRAATTTSQAIVTTTQAPTTTLPPTTTTVTTLPAGTPDGERYVVILKNADTGASWWNANYYRSLPFYPETGWTDGERAGYSCLYGFLMLNGQPVGRVTFARVEGAGYAFINDNSMKEGVRHYDGTLGTAANPVSQAECPKPDIAYEFSSGPWQLPTITYETAGGDVLEVRNYKSLVAGTGITFRQTETSGGRIGVVAYENGNPVVVVYYESIVSGVVMQSDLG
jgi:hypothetical protein